MNNRSKKGQALVVAILLLLMLAITVPTLVWWSSNDTRGAVREKKTTTAFHLAEAAVDRAFWQLESDTTIWTTLASCGTIAGFAFDTKYTDVPGGDYAIYMSSDSATASQRYVLGVGRDSSTNEKRAIKVVYSKPSVGHQAAYGANSDYFTMGGVQMHWGPIYSKTYIDVGSTSRRYPRKYSSTKIIPDPPYCSSAGCTHSGSPATTDNVEYWAYTSIPAQTTIDLNALKAQAQAQGKYYATSQAWNNKVDTTGPASCVYYINGSLDIQGNTKVFCNIIVTGYIHIQNGAAANVYDFIPPSTAWVEYGNIDTAAVGEFPGDAGFQTMNSTFRFGSVGCVTPQTCTADNIAIHGFLYAGTDIETQDTLVILGSIYQAGAGGQHMQLSGSFKVYYDPAVIDYIPVIGGTMTRLSWNEQPGYWPPGLP
jgi:hypothetical protein